MQAERNTNSVDLFKLIFSFFIIGIHIPAFLAGYSESLGWFFQNVIFRIAIPFFFITSAYFFFRGLSYKDDKIEKSKENFNKLKKYFSRLFILYTVWSLIYLVWIIPNWIKSGWFSLGAFIDFGIAAVADKSYYHLWFLVRLLYAIPIMYFCLRFIKIKHFVMLSLVIYFIGLFYGGTYSWIGLPFAEYFCDLPYYISSYRGVFFLFIPLCSLSLLIDRVSIGKKTTWILYALATLLFIAECCLLKPFNEAKELNYYVFSTLPMIFMLLFAIKTVNVNLKNGKVLRKLSTLVYVIHPLVLEIINLIVDLTDMSIINYITVAVVSLALSWAIYALSAKVKVLRFLM